MRQLKNLLGGLIIGIGLSILAFNSSGQSVDPLTGNLQFGVPLGGVSDGMLTAPIALQYHAGIRVEQPEGSAGMGWELSAGGAVVRNLKGLPDDYSGTGGDQRKGWLSSGVASAINNFSPSADDNLSTCADEKNDYDFIAGRGYINDSEPDIFNFYAPGLSGQFVFGADGNPKVIPYQDLAISKTMSGSTIVGLTITNNTGITYTFSNAQTTKLTAFKPSPSTTVTHFVTDYQHFNTALSFNSVWYLTSIRSANGNLINLSYSQNDTRYNSREVYVISEAGTETLLYTLQEETNSLQLSSIQSPLQTADFEWTSGGLGRVVLTNNVTSGTRTFSLSYWYARDSEESESFASYKKAFLREIREEHDCISFPSYVFGYKGLYLYSAPNEYAIQLPFIARNKQDLWGYYNGSSATKIPDVYVNTSASDAERYRIRPLASESPTLTGAGRVVNESYTDHGSLVSIEYPTGGITTIEYESNQYYDAPASASQKGAGIRVKRINNQGAEYDSQNIVTDYEYKESSGVSSGKLIYRPVFAFADGTSVIRTRENLAPDAYVLYGRSTVKKTGLGKTVYSFALPGMYPNTSESDWAATRGKIARYVDSQQPPPCISIGNQVNGYFSFPFGDNMNYDFERGLPTSIAEFSESGAKVMERLYSYQRLTPGITYVKGLRFEFMPGNNFVYGLYSLMTNVGKVSLTETVRTTDEVTYGGSDPANPTNYIETVTTYTYNSTHKMLAKVDVTNSDGIISRTWTKYVKDFAAITNPETTKPETMAIKSMNDTRRYGAPVETIQRRVNGADSVVIGANLSLYKDYGSGLILPYKQLSYPPAAGFTAASVVTNGSGKHELSYSANYLGTEILTYTSAAMPTGIKDHRGKKSGAHYGYFSALPVASFSNAEASEVVYEGFETGTGCGLASATSGTSAWAGFKAGTLSAGGYYSKSNVQKGGTKYIGSVWVKAAASSTITFKVMDGSTVIASDTASYGAGSVNKWRYKEVGPINVTSAPSSFTFRIETTAAADFDEILFHPSNSNIKTASYDINNGKVAELDGRGGAVFVSYDELGRPRFVKNKNKDVVQVKDYHFRKEAAKPANSNFTTSVNESNFTSGTQITFTSATNCSPVQSYQWKVDGADAGTSSTLNHTLSSIGEITIELAVTLTNGGYSRTSGTYCVTASSLSGYSLGMTPNDGFGSNSGPCHHDKTFTVNEGSGGCGATNTFAWSYKRNHDNDWTTVSGSLSSRQFTDHIVDSGTGALGYTMRCVITQNCTDSTPTDNCSKQADIKTAEVTFYITYVPTDTQCQ